MACIVCPHPEEVCRQRAGIFIARDMKLDDYTRAATARELYKAWRGGYKIKPFTLMHPEADLSDAYDIQRRFIAMLEADGYSVSGKKLGYTDPAMRSRMGLSEPSYGCLLSERRYQSGASISPDDFIQPGLEAEVLFRIGRTISSPERGNIIDSIDFAAPAFEIVDMRIEREGKTRRDSVGDLGSFGAYVLGDGVKAISDLAHLSVTVYEDGAAIASGSGERVCGDPINALLWLAKRLAAEGRPLEAGQEVMSGSFIPLTPLRRGSEYTADFGAFGSVSMRFGGDGL